jgi:hypothetical protein
MSDADVPPWAHKIFDQLMQHANQQARTLEELRAYRNETQASQNQFQASLNEMQVSLNQVHETLSRLDGRVTSLEKSQRRESDGNVSAKLSEQLSEQLQVSSSSRKPSQSADNILWRQAVKNFQRCKQYAAEQYGSVEKDPSDLNARDFLCLPLFSPAHIAAFGTAWPDDAVPSRFSVHSANEQKRLKAIIESMKSGQNPVSLSAESHGFTIRKESSISDCSANAAIRDLRNLVLFLNQPLDPGASMSGFSSVFPRTAGNLRDSFVRFIAQRNVDKESLLMQRIVNELATFFVNVVAFDSKVSEQVFRVRVLDSYARTLERSVIAIGATISSIPLLTDRVLYVEAELRLQLDEKMSLKKCGRPDAVVGVATLGFDGRVCYRSCRRLRRTALMRC